MEEYKDFKRAFIIKTKNNTYGEDVYVVIANNFTEAERLYWDKLNGYHDIISIEAIPNTKGVASI